MLTGNKMSELVLFSPVPSQLLNLESSVRTLIREVLYMLPVGWEACSTPPTALPVLVHRDSPCGLLTDPPDHKWLGHTWTPASMWANQMLRPVSLPSPAHSRALC